MPTNKSHILAKWVIKLGGEVRYLQHQAPHMQSHLLKKETRRYQRTLQFIYAESRRRKIDLLPFYNALTDIEATLKIIQQSPIPISGLREKIAIFIDGANLHGIAYDDLKIKIDYAKLLTYFSQNAIILRAFYYTAIDPSDGPNQPFLVWLKRNGYQVISKPIKEFGDGRQKGNLDIEIAIDMLELADKVDRVVLISGDGDFAPLLKRVGRKGPRTQVVSYWGRGEGPTAPELIDAADIFTEIKEISHLITR